MRPEYLGNFNNPDHRLPKINHLKQKTVITDLVTHDTSAKTGHRNG
jgi:hypothetical protein